MHEKEKGRDPRSEYDGGAQALQVMKKGNSTGNDSDRVIVGNRQSR